MIIFVNFRLSEEKVDISQISATIICIENNEINVPEKHLSRIIRSPIRKFKKKEIKYVVWY